MVCAAKESKKEGVGKCHSENIKKKKKTTNPQGYHLVHAYPDRKTECSEQLGGGILNSLNFFQMHLNQSAKSCIVVIDSGENERHWEFVGRIQRQILRNFPNSLEVEV